MATVRRKNTRRAAERGEPARLTLPTHLSKPAEEMGQYVTLLFGEKKIGKTTLAAQYPDAFFMMFEPGGKSLRIYQRPVESWKQFKRYVKLLQNDGGRFKTVVIDTADLMYKRCFDHVCQERHFEHPQDENDFGKSWGLIKDEFVRGVTDLLNLGKGVIFISHARQEETKTRAGRTHHVTQSTLAGQGREVLEAMVDIWMFYGYENKRRVLTFRGDEQVSAGTRLRERFRYDDGTVIQKLDVEGDEEHAYKMLVDAFNNAVPKPKRTARVAKRKVARRRKRI